MTSDIRSARDGSDAVEFSPHRFPSYHRPFYPAVRNRFKPPEQWDQVEALYDSARYTETLEALFDYIDTDLLKKFKGPEGMIVPHGSLTVFVQWDERGFEVRAPFVRLPKTARAPSLRQTLELNFSTLMLARLQLTGEELEFTYSCSLEECEPSKIYAVLKEICINGDGYDDEFIRRLGSERIMPVRARFPQADELGRVRQVFNGIVEEALQYVRFYERKRMFGYAMQFAGLFLKKIDYAVAPQGRIRAEIEDAIERMNEDLLPSVALGLVRDVFDQLSGLSVEEFTECVYQPGIFIPYRNLLTLNNLQQRLEETQKMARTSLGNADFIGAALAQGGVFYHLLYESDPPAPAIPLLEEGLEKASGLSWKEAATVLRLQLQKILELEEIGSGSEPPGTLTVQEARNE
ncbi:MAG: YbjN domain-containing protein [Leptonema illini]|uniref:YbjN domain-containing protein n=1 Tax=Leptonema illini TaxID=183 RepID=A0A833GZQ9_9LEPT|nr:MAG: YbjN domain-containing protein [Leptonema illini]